MQAFPKQAGIGKCITHLQIAIRLATPGTHHVVGAKSLSKPTLRGEPGQNGPTHSR
jgi:hypothetical protein